MTPAATTIRSGPPSPRTGLHGAYVGRTAPYEPRFSAHITAELKENPQVNAVLSSGHRKRGPSQVTIVGGDNRRVFVLHGPDLSDTDLCLVRWGAGRVTGKRQRWLSVRRSGVVS